MGNAKNNMMNTLDARGSPDHKFLSTQVGKFNNTSPRAIRSIMQESVSAFTVIPNAKIPDFSETRREDREERVQNLLRRPKHK